MKKIHITESQLKYIKKRLTEQGETDEVVVDAHAGASGKITTQDLTQQYNNAQKHVTNANVAMKVDGTDLKEDITEWEKDVDRDSNEYYQVKDYLESLVGTPQYFSLMGGINGTNMDTSMAIDNIQDYFGYQINRDVIFAALKDFRDEKNRAMIDNDDEYSDVMEKKIITKKQIKEAKLRNLRENCIRITKKNLK